MKLRAKVVTTRQQQPTTTQASTLTIGTCFSTLLLKFTTNENHQAALRRRKGLMGTKLGLDKDFTRA